MFKFNSKRCKFIRVYILTVGVFLLIYNFFSNEVSFFEAGSTFVLIGIALNIVIKILKSLSEEKDINSNNEIQKNDIDKLCSELKAKFIDEYAIYYSNRIISKSDGWNISWNGTAFVKDNVFYTFEEIVRDNLVFSIDSDNVFQTKINENLFLPR